MVPILATAFTAGLVSTVNPCGFAMLPAYLSYFLGLDGGEARGRPAVLARALAIGAVVSAGFLVVFGLAGVLITAGLRTLTNVIPWLALVVGVGLVVLGVVLLRGKYLNVRLPTVGRVSKEHGYRSVFLFGISYAVASLSCTLPIFLTLVAGTFTQTSLLGGLAAFLAYGLGMALVLLAVTLALALGKDSLVRRLRGASRHLNRISGMLLVAAGGFIIWYWATILSSGAESLSGSGIVRFVDRLSAAVTDLIARRALLLVVLLAAAVAAAVGYVAWSRRDAGPDEPADGRERQRVA